MNEKLVENLNTPVMLAKKAKQELKTMNYTTIVCPKCQTSPEITMTEKGERTIVSCNCGYVHDIDINF